MVLNDAGVIGLSLNGKSFPATEPYSLKTGDWMLVNYYNEGLQYHPMHLHQFPQLVVARDGIPLDYPYFADTISVSVVGPPSGSLVWRFGFCVPGLGCLPAARCKSARSKKPAPRCNRRWTPANQPSTARPCGSCSKSRNSNIANCP